MEASATGLESMAYLVPRAAILLIAWSTIGLAVNIFTGLDPLVFYLAGAVWSFVSLVSFSYLDRVWRDDDSRPVAALVRLRQPAK